jgi:hypothetical protein
LCPRYYHILQLFSLGYLSSLPQNVHYNTAIKFEKIILLLGTTKGWDKFLDMLCYLSGGSSLLGYSWYIVFQMADYSFASKIKLVLTLYLSASSFEYYDWEDDMEEFLWDRGLKSHMKIFFAKRTFF